jgi:hypothetical protein
MTGRVALGRHHVHAEALAKLRQPRPDRAEADDADGAAAQLAAGIRLPAAAQVLAHRPQHVAAEHQHVAQQLLGQDDARGTPRRRHHDAAPAEIVRGHVAQLEEVIGTGGEHVQPAQLCRAGQPVRGHPDPDHAICVADIPRCLVLRFRVHDVEFRGALANLVAQLGTAERIRDALPFPEHAPVAEIVGNQEQIPCHDGFR